MKSQRPLQRMASHCTRGALKFKGNCRVLWARVFSSGPSCATNDEDPPCGMEHRYHREILYGNRKLVQMVCTSHPMCMDVINYWHECWISKKIAVPLGDKIHVSSVESRKACINIFQRKKW